MVESEAVASGVRWPKSNWEIPDYLLCLTGLLLVFMPANRAVSVDAAFWSDHRSETVPMWTIWLLCIQVDVVFVFSGVAKINDDWLSGRALQLQITSQHDFQFFAPLLSYTWVLYFLNDRALLRAAI